MLYTDVISMVVLSLNDTLSAIKASVELTMEILSYLPVNKIEKEQTERTYKQYMNVVDQDCVALLYTKLQKYTNRPTDYSENNVLSTLQEL